MKFEGCGYEFDAKYIGGPADGLESSVVTMDSDRPPLVSYLETGMIANKKMPLGKHLLKPTPKRRCRVGVYGLEDELKDYDDDLDIAIYNFIEMMTYEEFVRKFGDKA